MRDVLHVFGASDDLIEITGALRDELYPAAHGATILQVMSNLGQTVELSVEYDPDRSGEWRVSVLYDPDDLTTLTPAPGEDYEVSRDMDDCPSYSDKATVRGGYAVWLVSR